MGKRILYFIQLPPPNHGVSLINTQVFESKHINRGIEKSLLEIKFSNSIHELRKFSFYKLYRFGSLLKRLISRLNSFEPDYVYFSVMPIGPGFIRDIFFIIIMKIFKVKIIYHIHNQGIINSIKKPCVKYLYQFVFSNAYIIHLSEGLIIRDFLLLNLKNTFHYIVPNGIPLIYYSGSKHNVDSGKLNLLFISQINLNKGIKDLLNAFQKIDQTKYPCTLTIAGAFFSKGFEREIRNFIKIEQLQEYIKIVGEVDQDGKYKLFSSTDIYIFPSLNDTFGIIVLEAMQAHLPVIISDSGALSEYLENYQDGIIYERSNVSALYDKIVLLLENEELRNRISINGNKRASEFSLGQFEKEMSFVFDDICSKK
jgi:glycosyltransferase involved in cell wall biosynthesis